MQDPGGEKSSERDSGEKFSGVSERVSDAVVSIRISPKTLAMVKEAAERLDIPFTTFIRMAARKEAKRVTRRAA